MRFINHKSYFILFLLLLIHNSYFITHTCYAAFEDIGAGARATGMGNVSTSLADDVYSLYYNPAGLGQLKQREVTSSYGKLYWGLDDGSNLGSGFLGLVYPLKEKWGTVGFGWLNFHLIDYYQENTLIISYGRKGLPVGGAVSKLPLFLGLNLKFLSKKYGQDIYTRIDPVFSGGYSKTGLSADLGLLYNPVRWLRAGLSVSDILQPDMGLKDKSIVPMGIKAGVSYHQRLMNVSVEGSYRDGEMKIYTGAEGWFLKKSIGVRAGFGMGNKTFRNVSFGTSYNVSLFRIDYAFLYPLSGLTDIYGSHRISLTLRFGPFLEEEIEDPAILRKKISELEEQTKMMEKKITETEEMKRKTEEEATKMKSELERLKAELDKIKKPPTGVLPKPPVTPTGPRIHTVVEGETLQSIAVKYYGDEKRWMDIYNANKDKIERGVVRPGQILVIP